MLAKPLARFRNLPAKCQVMIAASIFGAMVFSLVGVVLTMNDLRKIEAHVEAASRQQTELISTLSVDALIAEDRPRLQGLIDGLKKLDSGLVMIGVLNQQGEMLASWDQSQGVDRLVVAAEKINHEGQELGTLATSWNYEHFAVPIVKAKAKSVAVAFGIFALFIGALGVALQCYLISPLAYLERKIRIAADPTAPKVHSRKFVARELRQIDRSLDNTAQVLAEKTEALTKLSSERARAEDAEAAAQAKMDFLSLMSHEIRTPLGAMMGFGKLLESADLNEEERGLLGNLNSSGDFLLRVINDILDLSKIEANGIEFESLPLDPNGLLRDIERMIGLLAGKKGVELSVNCIGLDGKQVHGDQHRITQVLMNLAGNAIKFTEEGEVRIIAEGLEVLSTPDGETARVRFSVADTGIGMTQQQCEQIFAPFSQADSSVTRRFGGTGLGLSVSNQLVEGMGGDLSVVSDPGEGSTFSFELTMPIEDAVTKIPKKVRVDLPYHGNGELRILVAEDEAVNRILIEKIFAHLGHQVEFVTDGPACIDRLKRGIDMDVLFVDLHMPEPGGMEIARRLRGGEFGLAGRELKLAIMSADVLAENEGRELGVDAFIPKPIDQTKLEEFLRLAAQSTPPGEVGAVAPAATTAQPMKILVVEDQELNRQLLTRILGRYNTEVFHASDGIDCMEFLDDQPQIDAILLDQRMPRMDGASVAREIRGGALEGREGIPIAFVSAEVREQIDLKGLAIEDFIPKPIDLDKLEGFLKKVRPDIDQVALEN